MNSLIVTLSISLTAVSSLTWAQDSSGRGLQLAIKTALEKNPKIRSNDKTLEAMLLRVDSAKMSQLPSLTGSLSATRGQGSVYDRTDGNRQTYGSTSRGADVSLNWNIYDGGAKRKQIKSMECSFKERQASFNSTNTLIRNTQGQIASAVVLNYVELTRAQQNTIFAQQMLTDLAKVRSVARTEGEILETDNFISDISLELQAYQAKIASAANNFQYIVTEPPPAQLDSFQQMIDSLVIPETPDQALNIAFEKSPEIKTARYQIECMRLRYESVHAAIYSPRVDVSVGKSFSYQSINHINSHSSESNGTSAAITLSMSLNPGSSGELSAQRKEIESAEDNLEGTVADTKHNIEVSYPDLGNSIKFSDSYRKNYLLSQANIQKYTQNIDAHRPVVVADILKEMNNLQHNFYTYQGYTVTVLNAKFQIQKTVGILFENLGLQDSGVRNNITLN